MEQRRAEDLEWTPAGEHFTGRVWFGPLAPPASPEALNALGVLFEPGARTDWHSHPGGQVLYVVSGAGYVQNDGGETVAVSPGDVVLTPPGELHWHGAGPASYMMHLSLTTGGATEWSERAVTDGEYDSARHDPAP